MQTSHTHDDALINAIEAGDVSDVRTLLQAGASPNARKKVSLSSRVVVRHNIWRADDVEVKTDVIECESALVLAVIHGFSEIVEELLDHGANIEEKVAWTIANGWLKGIGERPEDGRDYWTVKDWESKRWYATITFPSILCLALGRCGLSTRVGLVPAERPDPRPDKSGHVSINHPGANVIISNPRNESAVRVSHRLQPRVEIVRALLSNGAIVRTQELRAAKMCPDAACCQAVESQAVDHSPPRASRSSFGTALPRSTSSNFQSTRASSSDPAALGTEQSALVERLRSKLAKAERAAETAKARTEEKEREAASLRSHIADVSARIASQERETQDLARENAALQSKNTALQTETSTLRQQVSSLTEVNGALKKEVDALHAQIVRQARTTRTINRLMYAVGNFQPRELDEIMLSIGDPVFVAVVFPDGWASGLHAGTYAFGFFPFSHVAESLPDPDDSSSILSQLDLPETSSRVESLTQSSTTTDSRNANANGALASAALSLMTFVGQSRGSQPVPAQYWRQFFGAISSPHAPGA